MKSSKKNALEWAVFALSACLVAATAGYLAVNALPEKRTPPELRVFTGAPSARADGHRVPLLVRNEGDATAESVRIEVVLRRGGEEVERAELDLALVPRKSEREGSVTFRRDPRCCALTARAVSYEKP